MTQPDEVTTQRTPTGTCVLVLAFLLALLPCSAPFARADGTSPTDDRTSRLDPTDERVDAALQLAGANRSAIEAFLTRYEVDPNDPGADLEKHVAARWLVANMPGRGFSRFALVSADGREIPFDSSEMPTLPEAQARLDELEREHGPLSFKVIETRTDLESISASHLIENHELAFHTWRTEPWAREVPFETFLEHLLPYRGTSEPLDPDWRREAIDLLAPELEAIRSAASAADADPESLRKKVAAAVLAAARATVRFRPTYYLHPTDQDWSGMRGAGAGRCEDITNMTLFLARAAGIAIADDFTPYWANRDNNHAWAVVLEADGTGSARLAHRAAKVYRHGFSARPDSLASVKRPDDVVPRRFEDRTLIDVTAQYLPVHDVELGLGPPPDGARVAYLCVFNAGEWRPIDWCEPTTDGRARFTDMGGDVLYLPAWFTKGGVEAAGAPFVLSPEGSILALAGDDDAGTRQTLALVTPAQAEALAGSPLPTASVALPVPTGVRHELFVWDVSSGCWVAHAEGVPGDEAPLLFEDVPAGGLYWLRRETGRGLERPFIVDGQLAVPR